jgi:protein required for attachment to host cells
MDGNRWVLVADSAQAQLYLSEDGGLKPVGVLTHPESQEHNQDLMGNRPNANQHGMERDLKGDNPRSIREDEAVAFAKTVASYLATAHAQNRFSELVLVADPKFLGLLRKALARPVAAAVLTTINKRAVAMNPADVADLVSVHAG